MSELLHDLSLLEEGLRRHGARLQGLYGHLRGAIPRAWGDKESGAARVISVVNGAGSSTISLILSCNCSDMCCHA